MILEGKEQKDKTGKNKAKSIYNMSGSHSITPPFT